LKLELGCFSSNCKLEDISRSVFIAIEKGFSSICVPAGYVSTIRTISTEFPVVAAVDFPDGNEITSVRQHSIITAARCGATAIDLVISDFHIINKNFRKIIEDIKTCIVICKERNLPLRAVIEYRTLHTKEVIELATILVKTGIDYIVTGTGTKLDSPIDNLATAGLIKKYCRVEVIAALPFCQLKELELAKAAGIYGVRFNTVKAVECVFGRLGASILS